MDVHEWISVCAYFMVPKITCLLYTTGLVPVSNSLDPQLSFGSLCDLSALLPYFPVKTGAVSTTVWTIVCKRALALVGAILVDTFGIFSDSAVPQENQPPNMKAPPSLN
ncbi:hypothetical protein MJO28_000188 [Puccinia striiformis f. sp. tritici]|uniref:Uncharacterized protein n=1 Tax=Puccinia striiformis f. sp. tritici TaxID=168172 RepID=A0ACC0EYH1_9BASI|nr:hypothetical protein MJO28_000188 [Puccinia striiformis f. sp. tritici]